MDWANGLTETVKSTRDGTRDCAYRPLWKFWSETPGSALTRTWLGAWGFEPDLGLKGVETGGGGGALGLVEVMN